MSALLARSVAVLMVTLLGAMAACSGEDSDSPREDSASKEPVKALEKGTCWSSESLPEALGEDGFAAWVEKYAGGDSALGEAMRDDVAFADEVDCSKPHALELYNVVEVAPKLTARVKDYADLLDQKSPLYLEIRDQVNDRCMVGSAYGRAQRKAGGLPVQLEPALNVESGLHIAWDPFPADLWERGQKKFVCTFEQDEPGTLSFADIPTSKLPVAARVCLDTPRTYLPCNRRHQAEDIAEMVLNTAIKQGEITGKKAVRRGEDGPYVALSDADYAKLDKICMTFLRSVSTVKAPIEAQAYPGSVSQWPTERGAYLASCFALKPFEPPPPIKGTVFNRP